MSRVNLSRLNDGLHNLHNLQHTLLNPMFREMVDFITFDIKKACCKSIESL